MIIDDSGLFENPFEGMKRRNEKDNSGFSLGIDDPNDLWEESRRKIAIRKVAEQFVRVGTDVDGNVVNDGGLITSEGIDPMSGEELLVVQVQDRQTSTFKEHYVAPNEVGERVELHDSLPDPSGKWKFFSSSEYTKFWDDAAATSHPEVYFNFGDPKTFDNDPLFFYGVYNGQDSVEIFTAEDELSPEGMDKARSLFGHVQNVQLDFEDINFNDTLMASYRGARMSNWWKSASGDAADYLVEQVQTGMVTVEDAIKEVNDQIKATPNEDSDATADLRARLLVLENLKNTQPVEQELPAEYREPMPDMTPRQASWWNGYKQAAPPHWSPNEGSENWDLNMDPGDVASDWQPQDTFRVGDEVLHTPSSMGGHIEETLDVDRYSVMLDDGSMVDATAGDLQHEDNDSPGETHLPDEQFDPSVFEGDDPEAQNFEDPTFNLSGYIDDDVDQLRPGDTVRILYTTDESQENLVNGKGTIVSADGGSYNVDVDGATLNGAERRSLELMPTDYNPHYGGDVTASLWKSAADPEREQRAEVGKEYDKTVDMNYLKANWSPEELVTNVLDAYAKSSDSQKYAGTEWYNDIHEKAKEFSGTYGYTFEQMCAVFAVISPQNSWDTNYVQAIAFIEAHNAGVQEWTDVRIWTPYSYVGKPCGLPDNNEKAWEILDTGDTSYIEYAESPKVFSFFQNFVHGPESEDNRATVDVWATRVLFADPLIKPLINNSDGSYPYLEQGYVTAAEQIGGLTPKQIQAVTWVYYKEFYGRSLGDMSYMKRFDEYIKTPYEERGDPNPEDLPLRPKKKKVDPNDYTRDEESDRAYDANKNEWRSKKKRKSEENAYKDLLKQENKRQREEQKRQRDEAKRNKTRKPVTSSWWLGYDQDWWKTADLFNYDDTPYMEAKDEAYDKGWDEGQENAAMGRSNQPVMTDSEWKATYGEESYNKIYLEYREGLERGFVDGGGKSRFDSYN